MYSAALLTGSCRSVKGRLRARRDTLIAVETLGKTLLAAAVVLALAGALILLLARFGIGRLPGDIVIRRGNFTLYAPIGLMLLASILLTILLNLLRR